MKTLLIALGGNALVERHQKGTARKMLDNLGAFSDQVSNLHNKGYRVVITHGNGPQVGNILLQQEKAKDYAPVQPLHVCVAQSQGMIGYFLQEALSQKLRKKGFSLPVVTIITQVIVDKNDPAFRKPSKPIGPFYPTRDRAPPGVRLIRTVHGYRRVVASPKPREIVEAKEIRKVSKEAIVIACGGGGIPVVKDRGLKGAEAVIDKDLTASLLAKEVSAHSLVLLTDVDYVYSNYKKPHQKKIGHISLGEARSLQSKGHFPSGSMGPKVQSAIRFLSRGGKRAVITHRDRLEDGVQGDFGTIIE